MRSMQLGLRVTCRRVMRLVVHSRGVGGQQGLCAQTGGSGSGIDRKGQGATCRRPSAIMNHESHKKKKGR